MTFNAETKQGRNTITGMIKSGLYGLIAVTAVVAVILAGGCTKGDPVPPSEDIAQVIITQYNKNQMIANLEYDPQLTFKSAGEIAIADGKALSPIEDNLYKKGKDGENILFDENIIGRVIQFNSDWVSQQNEEEEKVNESIMNSGAAMDKISEKAGAQRIAFHSLDIGEIMQDGKNYYVLTRENYTMADPDTAKLTPFEGVYVYKLVPQNDTLLIQDYELLGE
jgi:hypothetical protein